MKKNKRIDIITILLFAGLLSAFPLSWYVRPWAERAENSENRELAAFPPLSEPSDIFSFPAGFSDWYSDHLPYKETLVSIKSAAELSLFGQLASDQVILGTKTPWLFYKADDGQPLESYKRTNQFTKESLAKIKDVLYGLQTRLYEEGIDFVLMIVPDKETIYGEDYMPEYIKVLSGRTHRTDQLLSYLSEEAPDIKVVYPREEMLSEKARLKAAEDVPEADEAGVYAAGEAAAEGSAEPASLYYESDTHWNKRGAKLAADALFDRLSETDRNYLTEYTEISFTDIADGSDEAYEAGEPMRKTGDMQKLAKLPERYDSTEYRAEGVMQGDLIYEIKSPSDEAVYEMFVSADSRCAKKRIYLAGDSFRWNLREFLSGRAAESVICSRYYLDLDDVSMYAPDVFVYMIAERYLSELEGIPGVAAPALEYTEDFKRADIY